MPSVRVIDLSRLAAQRVFRRVCPACGRLVKAYVEPGAHGWSIRGLRDVAEHDRTHSTAVSGTHGRVRRDIHTRCPGSGMAGQPVGDLPISRAVLLMRAVVGALHWSDDLGGLAVAPDRFVPVVGLDRLRAASLVAEVATR